MTTFHVSLDGLSDLVDRLQTLSGELRDAKGSTPGYGGQSGSANVTHALDGFLADWTDGMHIIDANLDGLVDKLSASRAAYDGVECALVSDMSNATTAP